MSTESRVLFNDPSVIALMRRIAQDLRTMPANAVHPEGLTDSLAQIFEFMISNPAKFDEYASANVEWIGNLFVGEMNKYFESPVDKREAALRSIFTSAYRFMCELQFTQPGEPSFEVRRIMTFADEHLADFSHGDRQQLVYAAYTMPAQVVKKLLGHPSIGEFRKFSETIEESRKLKATWDIELETRSKLLKGLEENITKLTSEYNFVGLVDGFRGLKNEKEKERRFAFGSLIILALVMVLPPLVQLGFVARYVEVVDKYRGTLAYTLPTILAVEVILIYLFRVVLAQFRSVKAQLLQIDLRISLCQFIESFADYASRVRVKDASALTKFEALIFSSLVTDESGIPSTFDGVEQIGKLIRSARGGKE